MKMILHPSDGSPSKLLRDPYLVAIAALMVLVTVPLVGSWLSAVARFELYPYYFDAPLLALTAIALWSARRSAVDRRSRRFWGYLALGFAFWFCVRLLGPVLTAESSLATLATDLLYLGFYLFLILAFQLRPHLRQRDSGAHLLRPIESTGTTLFGFSLLVYFIVIPAAYNPSALLSNIPSTMLYVVLNVYLFWRALELRRSCEHAVWQNCYGWLLLATAGFVVLDGIDLASRLNEAFNTAFHGTLLEALWLLPLPAFVVAARRYVRDAASTRATPLEAADAQDVWTWRGKLVYFALVPPLIHIVLEIVGWSDDRTRLPRTLFVMAWVIAAAGLSLLYDRRLLRQQQLLEQRQRRIDQQFEAVQRMDALRRMAGGVAHDFNNLLMVIQGFADILVTRLNGDENRSDAEQILKASQRAGELTRKLIALGSTETTGLGSFDASEVLASMTSVLRQQAGPRLKLDLKDTGYVRGGQGAFEDAVLNLVLNARDATAADDCICVRSGTVIVGDDDVLASTLGAGTYGYAEVQDNGEGIDDEALGHIFEPFFTGKPGGTGLGLSMVYAFAREAGGTVQVDSKVGKGSRFRIVLPEAAPPAAVAPDEDARATPTIGTTRVLLVEDEEAVRRVLVRVLNGAGIDVLEACDGKDGLAAFEQAGVKPDVVITDIVMPSMDGATFARRIHRIDPDLPVIFMTGHSAGQLDQLGDLAETAKILRKPFAPGDLLVEIEAALKPGNEATAGR